MATLQKGTEAPLDAVGQYGEIQNHNPPSNGINKSSWVSYLSKPTTNPPILITRNWISGSISKPFKIGYLDMIV